MNAAAAWENFYTKTGLYLGEGVQESIDSLLDRLDERFDLYLRRRIREVEGEGYRQELMTLRLIIRGKSLSSVIDEIFESEMDLEATELLDADGLKKVLEAWGGFDGRVCEARGITHSTTKELGEGFRRSPMVEAGCHIWGSEEISTNMMFTMKQFFEFLKEEMIVKRVLDDLAEKRAKLESDVSLRLSSLAPPLIKLIGILDMNHDRRDYAVNAFDRVCASDTDPTRLNRFMDAIENELIDIVTDEESSEDTFTRIENIFMAHYPECWVQAETQTRVRLVALGAIKGRYLHLSHPDNFYFHPDEESSDVSEKDKEIWSRLRMRLAPRNRYQDLLAFKDGCVFTPAGDKVCWGDLLPEDIVDLEGTYYVLSQRSSFHEVPDAVRQVSSERKEHVPAYHGSVMPNDISWLHPDYVRVAAKGKIVNGEFILNPQVKLGEE